MSSAAFSVSWQLSDGQDDSLPRPHNVCLVGCRVPFEGENMHDLRSKVCSCSYRPITTGKYSKDLIGLVGNLLVLNPHKRQAAFPMADWWA